MEKPYEFVCQRSGVISANSRSDARIIDDVWNLGGAVRSHVGIQKCYALAAPAAEEIPLYLAEQKLQYS